MENNDLNDIDDDFDSGIELDKIEVPKTAGRPISETPAKAPIAEKTAEIELEVEPEVDPKKGLKFIVVIVVFFIFLGAAVFFIHQKTSFLGQGSNRAGPVVEYRAADPIITNLGADKHIKISLMIKNHSKVKEQISVTESVIRDRIFMFLTSQDTKRVINESDLKKVKSYINAELTHMLQNDYKDEIILKELRVY